MAALGVSGRLANLLVGGGNLELPGERGALVEADQGGLGAADDTGAGSEVESDVGQQVAVDGALDDDLVSLDRTPHDAAGGDGEGGSQGDAALDEAGDDQGLIALEATPRRGSPGR